MRKIIRGLLRDSGITNVAEAEDGGDALEKLSDHKFEFPDVIVCDLHMERISGTEFVHKLRRCDAAADRNVPVIILTGESDDMVLGVAKQVGANAVLQKPVSARALLEKIEAVVGYQIEMPQATVLTGATTPA